MRVQNLASMRMKKKQNDKLQLAIQTNNVKEALDLISNEDPVTKFELLELLNGMWKRCEWARPLFVAKSMKINKN